jgi:hypothetical protein
LLPTLEGIIARRVLLNYRIDPGVAGELVPPPLEVAVKEGRAVAGICLIRLEHLRPKGLPARVGLSSENMAHRIAIRYPTDEGPRDGVFIWRRETDRALVALLGGRLFPGVHGRANFDVKWEAGSLEYRISTAAGAADVALRVREVGRWPGSPIFPTFNDVRTFFERGDCGFSCGLRDGRLEGMQMRSLKWDMQPLRIEEVHSAFFDDRGRFPAEAIEVDGAVLMKGIPHEWHELTDIPEMAGAL